MSEPQSHAYDSDVDDRPYSRDAVGRKAGLLRMLADHLLVGGAIDAIDLVFRDVALNPLDVWSQGLEDRTGGLGRPFQIRRPELTDARHGPLDDELGHLVPSLLTRSVLTRQAEHWRSNKTTRTPF